MSTHIGAQPGEVAERVLLPGDPLRAEWIAKTFLSNASCYSSVRNMLGFTGTYLGVPISVQASGMGMPSASIYVHELLESYGVKTIVRVGSCGSIVSTVGIRDIVAAVTASTDSAINRHAFGDLVSFAPAADFSLLRAVVDAATRRDVPAHIGGIFTTDAFYTDRRPQLDNLARYGVLAVDMETAAIYTIAARFKARAVTVLTVSDNARTGERMTPQERERSCSHMVDIALDALTTPGPSRL